MALFQNECEEIGRWNQDRIHDEVRVLLERTGCDYMEELMTAVFVAHTKVLTAVRLSSRQKKLSITVPKLDHFIHRVFREAARCFWKSPFLFMDSGNVVERQKNILQLEALATESITTAIRGLLPVKQILKDYLEDDHEEIDDEDETVAEVTPAVEEVVTAPVAAPAPVAPAPTPAVAVPAEDNKAPDVINIDTEPVVRFSDYDAEFGPSGSTMKYAPKEGDDDDDDDISYGPADGILQVDESSTRGISDLDTEDLDGPAPAPIKRPADEDDLGEMEILE